jgi:hypothetical protein
LSNGTIFGAKFDRKKKTVSFYKDGVFIHTPFGKIDKSLKLIPVIEVYDGQ